MSARRRLFLFAVSGSLLLVFGSFQNCAPSKFGFGDVEMATLVSSAALSYVTMEDTPLVDVLPRAAALAGGASSVSVTSSPKHGDIKLNPNGEFTYTPYKDFFGEDEFEYSESGSTTTKNVTNKRVGISVRSVNDDPWLDTDLVNFDMNTAKNFSLTGKDVEDSQIDVVLESTGQIQSVKTSNGTLEMLAPSSFRYTPNSFFRGADFYDFVLKDSAGKVVTKKVALMVGNPFHGLQPALAVRGMGCISCHATVDSTVVTDFAKGSPYDIANHQPFNYGSSNPEKFYSDHTDFTKKGISGSWITSKISGNIIVPSINLGFDSNVEVQKLLKDYPNWINTYFAGTYTTEQINAIIDKIKANPQYNVPSSAQLKDYIQAVESQKVAPATVIEKSTVRIAAPTAAVILQRAAMGAGEKIKFLKNNQATSPALSGIELQSGGYYQNASGEVVCDGDLIVDGTLFLNNLVLKTDDGCRIMATGPIFLQGPITYQRIDTTRPENYTNLQLVSARFISLGVGKTHCEDANNPGWYSNNAKSIQNPFAHRFDTYGSYTRSTGKDAALFASDKAYNLAEMNKIVGLQDASCQGGTTPRQVNMERLLVNAPRIDSRYTGQFNGVIISEVALFSLSKFTFKYDNIFDRVPVLPILMPSDFLEVK